jgi:hypothetical protein
MVAISARRDSFTILFLGAWLVGWAFEELTAAADL